MVRTLALLAACTLLSGCFILDELDNAEALMNESSKGARAKEKAEEAAAARAPRPGPKGADDAGLMDRVSGYWNKATAPAPKPQDPENVLVRCELPGGTQFMRKYDCQLRGGRLDALPPRTPPPTQGS